MIDISRVTNESRATLYGEALRNFGSESTLR